MFKYSSVEDELYKSMQTNLVANKVEAKYGFDKLTKAVDHLNAAARIFDDAGMYKQAEEITGLLTDLSLEGLLSKLSDSSSAEETSEIIDSIKSLKPTEEDVTNILSAMPVTSTVMALKKLYDFAKDVREDVGDEGLFTSILDKLKDTFSTENIKDVLQSKIRTALKLTKILSFV